MEHDDLADAGLENLIMPSGDGSKVDVAHGTTRVAAKLQVHLRFAIGCGHGLPVDAHLYTRREDVAGVDLAVRVDRDHLRANFCQRFMYLHALTTTEARRL